MRGICILNVVLVWSAWGGGGGERERDLER